MGLGHSLLAESDSEDDLYDIWGGEGDGDADEDSDYGGFHAQHFLFSTTSRMSHNPLVRAISDSDWHHALQTLRTNRDLCKEIDDVANMTVLHIAMCASSPPTIEFVRELITIFPLALRIQDQDGNTVLHTACGISAPEPIFRAIFEAWPEASLVRNSQGQVPIQHSWRLYNISAISLNYAETLQNIDEFGNSVLTTFCKLCMDSPVPPHISSLGDYHFPALYTIRRGPVETTLSSKECWEIACFLIRYEVIRKNKKFVRGVLDIEESRKKVDAETSGMSCTCKEINSMTTIEAALKYTGTPFSFCYSAIQLHSDEVCHEDVDGNYPLHLAAGLMDPKGMTGNASSYSSQSSSSQLACAVAIQPPDSDESGNDVWEERCKANDFYEGSDSTLSTKRRGRRKYTDSIELIVEELLTKYSKAARHANKRNELPLQIMSRSSALWKSGVNHVLESYPSALHRLHLDEGLYPKVLNKIGNDCKLNTMFEVLKGIPDIFIIARVVRRSSRKRKHVSILGSSDR